MRYNAVVFCFSITKEQPFNFDVMVYYIFPTNLLLTTYFEEIQMHSIILVL